MIKEKLTSAVIELMERGWLSDKVVRAGIRNLLKKRLEGIDQGSDSANLESLNSLIAQCKAGPVAPVPEAANAQHYEVPAEFFPLALGKRLKYSSYVYEVDSENENAGSTVDSIEFDGLDKAEEAALTQSCQRAEIEDGMSVLELGCGWGSLTLWLAEKYPNSKITAVSNSNSQREYIVATARARGVDGNLTVITADMNDFQTSEKFDRICSIEMFEHMRNYEVLLKRVSQWLSDSGKLFVHIFCHKKFAYEFHEDGASNWMGRYFFTGGIMPSEGLFSNFDQDMQIAKTWTWNGKHYAKTADDWVAQMDHNKERIISIFNKTYGDKVAERWFRRWRILFMAGSELFGYDDGKQWYVAHYLFEKVKSPVAETTDSNLANAR